MKKKILSAMLALGTICSGVSYAETESFAKIGSHNVIVKGALDESFSNKPITLMLVKKNVSYADLDLSDIAYMTQTKINSDGTYKFHFKTNVDAMDYEIWINQNGVYLTQSVKEAKKVSECYMADVTLKMTRETASASVAVDNLFESGDLSGCNLYVAFYNEEDRLINVKKISNIAIEKHMTNGSFEVDAPADAKRAKAFIWTPETNIPLAGAAESDEYSDFIEARAGIANALKKLNREKKLNIVFVGGSVTYGTGTSDPETQSYPAQFMEWIKSEYPDADINGYNVGVPSTGSRFANYRLQHDVLSHNPDLVFMMHSINDIYCDESNENASLQFESIVRNILQYNPKASIVGLFDTDNMQAAQYDADGFYRTSKVDNEVAQYYNIPTIDLGRALVESKIDTTKVVNGSIDMENSGWYNYYSDWVHPNANGYAVFVDVIKHFWRNCMRSTDLNGGLEDKTLPDPYNKALFGEAHYMTADSENTEVTSMNGFEISTSNGYNRDYQATWYSNTNGEMTIKFTGKEFGLYGIRIDNSTSGLYNENLFSYTLDGEEKTAGGTNYPLIFAAGLEAGEHTVVIKNTEGVQTYIYAMMYR